MPSNPVDLKVDWCSHEAAKYAVMHWHYSKRMPYGKLVKLGIWEDGMFVGAVLFGRGATPQIGSPYSLTQTKICELVRVAMNSHSVYVSKVLSICIRMLKKTNSGTRLIVSFADEEQNHFGGIYQASNWLYAGEVKPGRVGFVVNGERIHTRSVGAMGGVQSLEWVKENLDKNSTEWIGQTKHRYLYPLDRKMRRQIQPLAKPYPKREHADEVSKVMR